MATKKGQKSKKNPSYTDILKEQKKYQQNFQRYQRDNNRKSVEQTQLTNYKKNLRNLETEGRGIVSQYRSEREQAGQTAAKNTVGLRKNLADMGLKNSGQRLRSETDLNAQNMGASNQITNAQRADENALERKKSDAKSSYVNSRSKALADVESNYQKNLSNINKDYYNKYLQYKLSKK